MAKIVIISNLFMIVILSVNFKHYTLSCKGLNKNLKERIKFIKRRLSNCMTF